MYPELLMLQILWKRFFRMIFLLFIQGMVLDFSPRAPRLHKLDSSLLNLRPAGQMEVLHFFSHQLHAYLYYQSILCCSSCWTVFCTDHVSSSFLDFSSFNSIARHESIETKSYYIVIFGIDNWNLMMWHVDSNFLLHFSLHLESTIFVLHISTSKFTFQFLYFIFCDFVLHWKLLSVHCWLCTYSEL